MGSSAGALGRFGFGVGGAIIGSFFGFPGLGFIVGSIIGSFIFPPESQEVFGPRLSDLKVSLSEYGNPIPILYGTMRLGCEYIWATDIVEVVTKQTESGKGGGGGTVTRTYTYFGNWASLFCDSPPNFPVEVVEQIFADGKLMADYSDPTGPIFNIDVTVGNIRIYLGDEDQFPDPLIESHVGVGLTPAYRGSCYVVFDNIPLEDYGNRIPQINAVVSTVGVDIYPKIEWTEWNVNASEEIFSSGGIAITQQGTDPTPSIVNSLERKFIVDGVPLQQMIRPGNSNGNNYTGFFDVNALRQGISHDATLALTSSVGLHDVLTGQAIGRSEEFNDFIASNTLHRFAGDKQQYIISYGHTVEADQFQFWSSVPTSYESIDPTVSFALIEKLGPLYSTNGQGGGIDLGYASTIQGGQIAVDGTGTVWIATVNGSSDVQLNIASPTGLELVTTLVGARISNGLGWEPITNSIWWYLDGATSTIYRWEIDSQTLTTVTYGNHIHSNAAALRETPINGLVYLGVGIFGPDVIQVDLVNMEVLQQYDINGNWGLSDVTQPFYVPQLHAVIMSDSLGDPWWIFLDRKTTGGVTLKSILDNLDFRVDYIPDVDTDASPHATTIVPGWVVGNRTQVKSVKQSLTELYQFLVIEEDHVIKHPPRGTAVIDALVSDDLGAVESVREHTERLEETRLQEIELPRQVEYEYISPGLDYQNAMQMARRIQEIVNTSRIHKTTFPVNLSDDEARRRAEVALHQAWMDRTQYRLSLMPKKMRLSPGDVITVTHENQSHVITLTQVEFGANNRLECLGVGFPIAVVSEADTIFDNITTLNTALSGATSGSFIPGVIEGTGNETRLAILDIPLLSDNNDPMSDNQGVYVSAMPLSSTLGWDGALISRAATISGEENEWLSYDKTQQGIIGVATTTLGKIPTRDGPKGRDKLYTILDTTNTVTILLDSSIVLASTTFLELTKEKEAWLIGNEIVQAMTYTDNGNGSWTLSNLLRGRRGTHHQDTHSSNERVVRLDTNKLSFKEMGFEDLDLTFYYRPYTFNGNETNPIITSAISTGQVISPPPVTHVSGSKSGSDWVISAKRAGRRNAHLQPTNQILLAQSDHDYEVDILSEDKSTVVRTITSTASSNGSVVTVTNEDSPVTITYKSADITADFTDPNASYPLYRIWVRIYQLEPLLGGADRGRVKEIFLEAFPDPIPSDANFSNVSLLLHCNSLAVRDRGASDLGLLTTGSAVTVQEGRFLDGYSQYESAVLVFPNSASGTLTLPRANLGTLFDFDSGDFTVECWINQIAEQSGTIAGIWGTSGNFEWQLSFITSPSSNGIIELLYTTDGSSVTSIFWDLQQQNVNRVVHIAVARQGNTARLYWDGQFRTSKDFTGITIFSGGNADLVVGNDGGTRGPLNAHLDSLRITKGVARYTSTGSITPPAHRFANN